MSRILKTGTERITQKFTSGHKGLDIRKAQNEADAIIAHTGGKVVFCQTGHKNNKGSSGNASYGNCVKIDHLNGYYTLYAHLDKVYVKLGQTVTQGQDIGYMGNTGNSYGFHLHFEVRKGSSNRINPTPYLNADLPNTKQPEPVNPPAPEPTPTIDLLTLVKRTIKGEFGNGEQRKRALGSNYAEVQKQVNLNVKNGNWTSSSIRLY